MRLKLLILSLLLTALLVAACNRSEPTPAPTTASPTTAPTVAEPTVAATVAAPTATSVTVTTPVTATNPVTTTEPVTPTTPVTVDPAAARTTLAAMLIDSLTVSVPVTTGVGIEGAFAFPLTTTNGTVLWLAHSIGIRSFDPEQAHVMAIYTPDGDSWTEVARTEFVASGNPEEMGGSPDYLGEGGITQVQVEPEHIWLQIEGGAGAHSGVYGLYSFDGSSLAQQISGFSSSPGVGRVEDVNGDGIYEVLIDATDFYIFCYACGVRAILYNIWYWDGAQMTPVELQPLTADAPAEVTAFNDSLIVLAQAGLWQDAQTTLDGAAVFSYTEPALQWNLAYVRVNAAARQAAATEDTAYPLLSKVFYGDYAGAVELLREEGADGLFIPETALITGTVAEGWQPELADRLTSNATAALAVQPDLAAAYFIRGWGEYVRAFDETAAVVDVQKAAELAPDDELYSKSVEFLTE